MDVVPPVAGSTEQQNKPSASEKLAATVSLITLDNKPQAAAQTCVSVYLPLRPKAKKSIQTLLPSVTTMHRRMRMQ